MLNVNIDPITFEVLSHRLHQITREMGIALERTGGTVTTTLRPCRGDTAATEHSCCNECRHWRGI